MLVLILAGCANSPKPVADKSERFKLNGFSVLSPNEDGWFILDEKESSITFGKKPSDDEDFATFASASLLEFTANVENEKEFLETVKSLREIFINPDEQQIISHNERLAPKMGKYCVKYMIKTMGEDLREKYGMTCRHPKNKELILDSSVLQKGAGKSDTLIKTAAKFLPHVQFEELK